MATAFQTAYQQNLEKMTIARDYARRQRESLNSLYQSSDFTRQHSESARKAGLAAEPYRSDFRRDFARLIHSTSFRRLKGKMQLFPDSEGDYFRNRLTHSLEVAQVAKSIAIKFNHESPLFKDSPIDLDLVEFAALAHDGNPPLKFPTSL